MEKTLIGALLKVQQDLPEVGRESEGYNYKYADLPTVWEAVKKVIQDNGFVVTHHITPDGVKTVARHEAGELESFLPFTGATKPQDIGSEVTYWKRYNLCAIFNIIIKGEDDDAQTAQNAKKPASKASKVQGGNCPKCAQVMKVSGNTGKPYCPGFYDGTCIDKTKPPQYSEVDQKIVNELDNVPVK